MWPNQMVKSVKVDVARKDYKSYKSRWHMAHTLMVHIIIGDINIPRQYGITASEDVQLLLPAKIPEAPKVEVTD